MKTFVTYAIADFLSNFIQHPTQRLDYGLLNLLYGQEVDNKIWGTRTEHILGVAACLALSDHTSQHLFSRYLGQSLCFTKSPAAFVAHTFLFIFSGVGAYVAVDAALNPQHDGHRIATFKSGAYSTYIGSSTAWYEPYVSPGIAALGLRSFANSWSGAALMPATLAYTTVKGVGWDDWGNSGLSDHERKLNGLEKYIVNSGK